MSMEDALEVIRRLGAKHARLVYLDRREAEIAAEKQRVRDEIKAMAVHAAQAAEALL